MIVPVVACLLGPIIPCLVVVVSVVACHVLVWDPMVQVRMGLAVLGDRPRYPRARSRRVLDTTR